MNKQEVLEKYNKEEERLLVAKILDKVNFSNTRNSIENTDFLDMYQKKICEKVIQEIKVNNYTFFGGFEGADKNMLIFYPEKLENLFKNNKFNYNTLIRAINIILPSELYDKYHHKDYLSGLMKLGIKREKCGDILTRRDGAYIIVTAEMAKYIKEGLAQLTRFSKSNIEIINIEDIEIPQIEKDHTVIIVPAMRLDSIVSEIIHTSRNKANEIIDEQRVFVNYENETRKSKEIKEEDIIVIRGKGKFKILSKQGTTKTGKILLKIEKYK